MIFANDHGVLMTHDMLMAIITPIGKWSSLMSIIVFLKISEQTHIIIERSELELINKSGQLLEKRSNAFGLSRGTKLSGPYSEKFGDDNYRPLDIVNIRWHLNDFKVEANLYFTESDWQKPILMCLPFKFNLPNDYHLIVTIVNTSEYPLNIQAGMQQAIFWVDKIPYASTAARLWNGEYLLRPAHTTICKFRLDDFPEAPQSGLHDVSIQMFGIQSTEQSINWYTPCPPSPAPPAS